MSNVETIEPIEQLKQIAAVTAVNKMLRGKHFSICELDTIVKMMGVTVNADAYNILRTLHCVDYSAMPRELLDNIPQLLSSCLENVPAFQFPMPFQTPPPTTVVSTQFVFPETKKKGILDFFRGEK